VSSFPITYENELHLENMMPQAIVVATPTTADLEAFPITAKQVLAGTPETRVRELARSHDRTSAVVVWDCTAGRFTWYYDEDETLVVLTGEAFITNERGEERQIGSGDIVFFPAGTSSRWTVPNYIKKVAIMRHAMPRSLGLGVRAWTMLRSLAQRRISPSVTAWLLNGFART
jgi:uncharacterized cupin superfamily protein